MFEFSTNSIIIIAVCVVAIILLLFLYLYISRKEKQGRVMTDPEKSTDNSLASEQAQKPLAAVPQAEEGKAAQPTQAFAAEAQKARHFSQEEELAASVEELLGKEEAAAIIRRYSRERVLFGTDFPMWNPAEEMERFLSLGLTDDEKEKILRRNAEDLLRL